MSRVDETTQSIVLGSNRRCLVSVWHSVRRNTIFLLAALMAREFDGKRIVGRWTREDVDERAKELIADMMVTPTNEVKVSDLIGGATTGG
ncbi:hypothetical protein ACP70R_010734 [Stipagrostis hirtigluma subsp. patula]